MKKWTKEIDEVLTQECFYCGAMLIDAVDNDIEVREPGEFDDDYDLPQIDQICQGNAYEDDEWGIQ